MFKASGYREMRAEIRAKEEAEKRAAVKRVKEERKRMRREKMKSKIKEIIKKSIRKTERKGRARMDENTVVMAIFHHLCYTITNIGEGEISDACKGR